ncbi:hypothetical protein D9M71_503330 [compost metagenome]
MVSLPVSLMVTSRLPEPALLPVLATLRWLMAAALLISPNRVAPKSPFLSIPWASWLLIASATTKATRPSSLSAGSRVSLR